MSKSKKLKWNKKKIMSLTSYQGWAWLLTKQMTWFEIVVLIIFLMLGGWLYIKMFVLLPQVNTETSQSVTNVDQDDLKAVQDWSEVKAEQREAGAGLVRGKYFIGS